MFWLNFSNPTPNLCPCLRRNREADSPYSRDGEGSSPRLLSFSSGGEIGDKERLEALSQAFPSGSKASMLLSSLKGKAAVALYIKTAEALLALPQEDQEEFADLLNRMLASPRAGEPEARKKRKLSSSEGIRVGSEDASLLTDLLSVPRDRLLSMLEGMNQIVELDDYSLEERRGILQALKQSPETVKDVAFYARKILLNVEKGHRSVEEIKKIVDCLRNESNEVREAIMDLCALNKCPAAFPKLLEFIDLMKKEAAAQGLGQGSSTGKCMREIFSKINVLLNSLSDEPEEKFEAVIFLLKKPSKQRENLIREVTLLLSFMKRPPKGKMLNFLRLFANLPDDRYRGSAVIALMQDVKSRGDLERPSCYKVVHTLNYLLKSPEFVFKIDQTDVSEHPRFTLVRLSKNFIEFTEFPRIEYDGLPGSDYGGLSRDFAIRLSKALEKPFGTKGSKDGWFPDLGKDGVSEEKCEEGKIVKFHYFYAIGSLIGAAFSGNQERPFALDMKFDPRFFSVLQSITRADMEQIPGDPIEIWRLRESEQNDLEAAHPWYPKLFKAYLKECFSSEDLAKCVFDAWGVEASEENLKEFLHEYRIKENVLLMAVFASAIGGQVRYAWDDDFCKLSAKEVKGRIEGAYDRSLAVQKIRTMQFSGNSTGVDQEKIRQFLDQWSAVADDEVLKNFCLAITGGFPSTSDDSLWKCEVVRYPLHESGRLPEYHTCFYKVCMPYCDTFNQFKQNLEEGMKYALAGDGFQLA